MLKTKQKLQLQVVKYIITLFEIQIKITKKTCFIFLLIRFKEEPKTLYPSFFPLTLQGVYDKFLIVFVPTYSILNECHVKTVLREA